MYAKRLNKAYNITTAQEKQAYLARGYDIYDDDDTLIAYSPQKTVSFSEYEQLRHAHEELLAAYASLQANYDAPLHLVDGTPKLEEVDPETLHFASEPAPKMGSPAAETVSDDASKAGKKK